MSPFVRFGNALGAGSFALILAITFGLQFILRELPCPLCQLQRLAIVLCGFGFILNLRLGAQPAHYGLILLSALFGLAVSGRQVLLHIVPGSGSYGSAIMGLHLYSWGVLLFLAVIAGVAFLMMLSASGRFDHVRSDAQAAAQFTGFSRLMSTLLIMMTLANAGAAFALCGPLECPDTPTGYWIEKYLPAFMR
jgi:disulfide bond formation protein DsbB